jgi:hypothetical protein
VATRWGTREEFLRACDAARLHGIDILIDAVLNVSFFPFRYFSASGHYFFFVDWFMKSIN